MDDVFTDFDDNGNNGRGGLEFPMTSRARQEKAKEGKQERQRSVKKRQGRIERISFE